MRLRRYLCLVLLCAVTCCGLFSVSVYASENNVIFVWDDTLSSDMAQGYVEMPFSCNGVSYSGWGVDWLLHYRLYYQTNTDEKIVVYVAGQGWIENSYRFVKFDSYDGLADLMSNYGYFQTICDNSDIQVLISSFEDQFNVQQIVIVLAAAAGICVGLVFLWWGARKITGALIKAFKKGKLRI